ncbi:MAG: hypothetical protein QM778_20240 [Myxococcales bacterium]
MLLALVCSTAARVRAQEAMPSQQARASLVWRRGPGAEECISPERLEKALSDHLGYAAFDANGDLVVQGTVSKADNPPRFRAEVELRDRQGKLLGRREVEAPGSACGALDEALVLVLSLAIDTQLTLLAAQATPSEPAQSTTESGPANSAPIEPEPKAVVAPAPVEVTQAPPTVAESHPKFASGVKIVRVKGTGATFGLLLAVGSGFTQGLMPATAWDLGVTLGFRTPSLFGVELSGTFVPFGRVPTDQGYADFRAGLAELRGCAPLLRAPVLLDGCVGFWNGVLRARAHDFSKNMARTAPLSGATAHVRAAYDFSEHFFARAAAGLGVPFVRDRFTAVGTRETRVLLHRVAPVVGSFGLELGVHFR